ncbi:MAG: SusD/RagB family nutrient-binding outer membrane lipoprotein [Bacteroidales bacterium]|nr:SusD/RagB family nutrient-binding outer membrane lipoprotein [Bacteroidales bacterium]
MKDDNKYGVNITSPQPPSPRGKSQNLPLIAIILLICSFILFFSSCEDWLDVNKDPNNPDEANEQLAISSGISSVAYVYGGKYQVLGALWSQHWTQSLGASQYSGLDSYDINSSTFDNRQYGELFTGALKNLEYVRTLSFEKQNWGYYLIATVMQCYTFQLLADLYDDIPFSEALKGEDNVTNPHFEKGEDIYDSLIVRLDFALSRDFEAETAEEIGSEDLLFEGNIERWKQFANTLKLKIYLRQVYKNPEISKTGIENLYQNPDVKFLTTDAAMTQFVNETGRANPLYETEVRFLNNPNLILSYTLYSLLSDNGDLERLNAMFDFPEAGGGHKSLIQGNYNDPDEPTGTNSSSYSKPVFIPAAPVYLMSASEAYFLQSEAIVRFGTKSYSTARELYQKGIEASFLRLLYPYGYSESQITGIAEDFYGPGDPYTFPVEGSPVEEFIKTIIIQKWVSLAGIQSLETFFEHNRTHYPGESQVPASDEGNYVPGEFTISVNNVTSGRFPKRLMYPESEYSANINTPEKKEVYEKIWWDVKTE